MVRAASRARALPEQAHTLAAVEAAMEGSARETVLRRPERHAP